MINIFEIERFGFPGMQAREAIQILYDNSTLPQQKKQASDYLLSLQIPSNLQLFMDLLAHDHHSQFYALGALHQLALTKEQKISISHYLTANIQEQPLPPYLSRKYLICIIDFSIECLSEKPIQRFCSIFANNPAFSIEYLGLFPQQAENAQRDVAELVKNNIVMYMSESVQLALDYLVPHLSNVDMHVQKGAFIAMSSWVSYGIIPTEYYIIYLVLLCKLCIWFLISSFRKLSMCNVKCYARCLETTDSKAWHSVFPHRY